MFYKTLLFWTVLLASSLGSTAAWAQCTDLTPAEGKDYQDALRFFKERRLIEAKAKLEKIATPCFDISYMNGRVNSYLRVYDQAIKYYEDAIALNPDKNDTIYFDLANALKYTGQYDNAKTTYQKFLQRYPVKDANDFYVKQANFEMEGCDYAKVAKELDKDCPTWRVYSDQGLDALNEADNDDQFPALFVVQTDSFIIFTSHRAGATGTNPKKKPTEKKLIPKGYYAKDGQPFSDLWIVTMESDSTFGTPENMGKSVNTKTNDASAVIDPTGSVMYYSICGEGKSRKKYGCSIYESKFDASKNRWGTFEKVPGLAATRDVKVNSRGKTKKAPTYDVHPTLADGGNTMYFVSDREGGAGGLDIWVSTKTGETWSTPINAGKSINTPANETSPHIGADGKTLYFASKGYKGFGGYDLYKASGKISTWSEPENMGFGINTSFDDFGLIWTQQDTLGYLTSSRNGNGRDDIFRIVKNYCPQLEITVQGNVRDEQSKQAIPFATVILYSYDNDNLVPVDTFKTQQDGRYSFSLQKGYKYKLVGTAPEYLTNEVIVDTRTVTGRGKQVIEQDVDILLTPIEIDVMVLIQNIYYDFDKADLRAESKTALDKLVRMLTDNPSITIQVASHTDTNGSEKYNIRLSNRRSKSVVDYLEKAGIDKRRLSSFGFGESRPAVYPELTDADEQSNRRTEFRIRTMDFNPTAKKK